MPRDVRWRDPDLPEVIEFLGNSNNVVRANAAAYLQHLCFMDNDMKQKARSLGGIPPLLDQLNLDIPELHRNACGALRNLSFGRSNDENKRAIRNAGGIQILVRLLRKTQDNEVRELVTGILWNLSSCEDLKKPIIDEGLTVVTNNVIIPHSGWDKGNRPDVNKHYDINWSTVFRNASGILRNVSSAGEYARKKLRECDGLVDAILHLVKAAIGKSDVDNKSVENCVCILRNLSYRCQEVDDPDYDKHVPTQPQNRTVVPSKVGDNLGCFGASKKKKELAQSNDRQRKDMSNVSASTASAAPRSQSDPAKGMELLWQPEIVPSYLALLSECSNPDTLEASAGALQNLSACYWQPSIDFRASVRKEKGLPILVELLRMENDRVVCAVATALRNLAIDQRNKELIGKYAIRDLVQKLPNGNPQHDTGTSDDTIAAVLATMNEVVKKNSVFARTMVDAGGVDRLMFIQKNVSRFSGRVIKFNQQLLQNLWQHQDLHEAYRKNGWKEQNFMTRRPVVVRSQSPHNNTLSRPMSTQGGTKYEDRTLPRGRDLNTPTHNAHSMDPRSHRHPEEMQMQNIQAHPPSYYQATGAPIAGNAHPHHRVPVGGVPIFPPAPQQPRTPGEPVYAQVNRDRKKNRQFENNATSQSTLLDNQVPPGGGDSWV
ncbi:Catenin delta-2 [Nymphon striatum]|nr:Catenin delta-2 [Nymphon striatum]